MFGLPEGEARSLLEGADVNQVFLVDPDNWEAVTVFMQMQTQWVYAGMSGVMVGLNYQSLQFIFDTVKPVDRLELFDKIQLMERTALNVIRGHDGN